MDLFLKKYPIPVVGLMLGLAAVGNLIQSYGEMYRNIFGLISAILLVLMVVKILKFLENLKENLDNPVVASVFLTFFMGIMLLSTYIKTISASFAFRLWFVGLILWFTKRYTFNFKIKQVFPSWFVVYVGIVVASVTGPSYNMTNIG